MDKPEETYPYCRYCGKYMGYPTVPDHAERHLPRCEVVAWRKANSPVEAQVIFTGDTFDFSALSDYKSLKDHFNKDGQDGA